jgi:preprotein translocase subunit SecB
MEATTAKLKFNGYKILQSSISLPEHTKQEDNLNVNFERKRTTEQDNKSSYYITVSINNQDKTLSIRVEIVGYFECDPNIDTKLKEEFFNGNAPAILFPYVRAYISALTALSGGVTLTLPTLNFAQLSDSNE